MKYHIHSLIIVLLLITAASQVDAIPAFARRYKISCSTCHAPFPKLKEYGDEFAGNGMILKEEEKARDYVSAGDDMLWLNRTMPIAVRFEAYGLYDEGSDIKKDLQSPYGIKLLSGGALYKNIGYYFYFYMFEQGEVAGIEDAYVHFNDLFGIPLDIMVGQFQTSDPLMKRELRLTYEDYMIYKARTGLSATNLTYDRGLMFLYTLEKTGTDLVAQIVNGNGKPEAGDNGKYDTDDHKNLGFRINQDFGIFSAGVYLYTGTEADTAGIENDIRYWGPDLNTVLGPMEITAQYLVRKDSDARFDRGGEIETHGTVLELIFSPKLDKSRYFITGLYNDIDSDDPVLNYRSATLSATWLTARNLRLTVEITRDLEHDKNRFVAGMVSGF
ncbi:hypothetical protein JW948_13950 [bacterium]|nr:hypothetical protein [bacterium]